MTDSVPNDSVPNDSVPSDSVAVDAKRILLRYGAPISVLDDVSEKDRIAYARTVAKTSLPDRQKRLRELLREGGYMEGEEPEKKKKKKKKKK